MLHGQPTSVGWRARHAFGSRTGDGVSGAVRLGGEPIGQQSPCSQDGAEQGREREMSHAGEADGGRGKGRDGAENAAKVRRCEGPWTPQKRAAKVSAYHDEGLRLGDERTFAGNETRLTRLGLRSLADRETRRKEPCTPAHRGRVTPGLDSRIDRCSARTSESEASSSWPVANGSTHYGRRPRRPPPVLSPVPFHSVSSPGRPYQSLGWGSWTLPA